MAIMVAAILAARRDANAKPMSLLLAQSSAVNPVHVLHFAAAAAESCIKQAGIDPSHYNQSALICAGAASLQLPRRMQLHCQ